MATTARIRASATIVRRLTGILGHQRARAVFAFLHNRDEPAIDPLLRAMRSRSWQISAPVVTGAGEMRAYATAAREFHRYNHYRIREPRRHDRRGNQRTRLPNACVMLVPLSAFDDRCHRTGMGGGYYDRLLHALGDRRQVLVIGVAFDRQRQPAIAPAAWDIAVDAIVTERSTYRRPGSHRLRRLLRKPL